MPEYSYKGFKVMYDVQSNEDVYQANAKIVCHTDSKEHLSQQFQTISDTEVKAKNEIKRLVKNYIDFEWKEFLKMQGERQKEALYRPK